MQAEITMLTRRGAAVLRRAHQVSADSLRFGRGTGNEVPLPDIRVGLSAAALHQREGGLSIEQTGDTPLRMNGGNVRSARVGPGDAVLIGPYEIRFSAPPEGIDAAFSVELVQPIGDALQRIARQSRIGLARTHLSKRGLSWALLLIVAALCLAAPILAYEFSRPASSPVAVAASGGVAGAFRASWNPGQISNQHRYFAQACGTCHQGPFREVADKACLTCHSAIGNHIPTVADHGLKAARARLAQDRCADCHIEHRGLRSLVIRQGALCVDCHRNLAATAPQAGVLDVNGFPRGHPQFRARIVERIAAGAAGPKPIFAKVSLGGPPKPADHPGLRFSHPDHLRPEGFPVLGYKPLHCDNCHTPDPSGQGFLPITFKGRCQRCHYKNLQFDIALPWKQGPHGDDTGVAAAVEGFYAADVLQNGVPPAQAPAVAVRIPGAAPASPPLPKDARQWVAQKTKEALTLIFDPKRGCFECHVQAAGLGPFRVAPVMMLARFLPAARFDHRAHAAVRCEDCHAARQARSSADVLIPGKGRCTTCHGAENAAFNVQSTCTTCHVFHRPELGPMRQAVSLGEGGGTGIGRGPARPAAPAGHARTGGRPARLRAAEQGSTRGSPGATRPAGL